MSAEIRHPALRYFGGKWRLAPWIISHFPAHTCFVEPFGGAASVLLRKKRAPFEIYNDLDGEMVNFFRVLRDQPEELSRRLHLTPYSRQEYDLAHEPATCPIERARLLFIQSWQGFGGPRKTMKSWKFQRKGGTITRSDIVEDFLRASGQLAAVVSRMKTVQIEHDDALKVIARFDTQETLFYCDPPYPAETRNARWMKRAYTLEVDGQFHSHLADQLRRIDGFAVVSTYPNPAYDELYAGWVRVERTQQTMNKTIAKELLYLSPRTSEALQTLESR